MIDRGDIRQAIDRCSNIWASLPGAGYVSSSIRLTAWLQNSKKRAERSERLVYGQVHAIISTWTYHSSSACHGLLIITVITPLPTKPSATKMPENWSWRTRQLLTCRCVAWCLLRSMQNTRRVSWCAKTENDALRDDVAAGRRRLHIKAVCQSVREATTASGVDNAASPRRQTPWAGLFHLGTDPHMQKKTGRNPEVY